MKRLNAGIDLVHKINAEREVTSRGHAIRAYAQWCRSPCLPDIVGSEYAYCRICVEPIILERDMDGGVRARGFVATSFCRGRPAGTLTDIGGRLKFLDPDLGGTRVQHGVTFSVVQLHKSSP